MIKGLAIDMDGTVYKGMDVIPGAREFVADLKRKGIPFTFVTNALEGNPYMGSYLGLFNGTICLPQIVAAATGGLVLKLVGGAQSSMLIMAGVYLVLGAACVLLVKLKPNSNK